jgi:predicted metal-dependent hydrolase
MLPDMSQSSNPTRTVPTRRMAFDEHLAQVPKHFAEDGDVLMSHFWAILSASFPEGEDFFVRSVRHYRDQITDPVLKRQVAGFIGQEAMHGREHRVFNECLQALGYPVERMERLHRRMNALQERLCSPETNLASTVVAEHFTALLAELVLTDESFRAVLGHQAVQDIYVWHALEESEHKAVAFDVYRAMGGSERNRIWSMKLTRWALVLIAILIPVQVFVTDPAARRPGVLRRGVRRFRSTSLMRKEMWEAIKDFEREDFHPEQRDTTALLDEWRERLFGDEGTLNDRLVGSTAV